MADIDPVEFLRRWLPTNYLGKPIPMALVADLLRAYDAKAAEANRLRRALKRLSDALAGNIPTDDPEFPVNAVCHAMAEASEALNGRG